LNKILFDETCDAVIHNSKAIDGIGTLQEKTIHQVLKHYFSPDTAYHEIKVGSYIADIMLADGHIIEIQSKGFHLLRGKLEAYLKEHKVTVVYPICYRKTLYWVDPDTGAVTSPRKSPKTGTPELVFPELYRIKQFLTHPNLEICLVLMDIDEYKLLNGYGKDRKKGASRNDGFPTALYDEIYLSSPSDYRRFIPESLNSQFTSTEYGKAVKGTKNLASLILNILTHMEVVKRTGKQGNAYLYERK